MMSSVKTKEFSISLSKPYPYQEEILKSKAKYRIVPAGRRAGKSETAKIAANIRLLKGQGIWFCSPTNQNSRRMFRQFTKLYKDFPEDLVKINKTELRIDFLFNDGWIEFKSLAEPDNLRGEGLDFVVVDEAAFVLDGIWEEVLEPMLLTSNGDALFISSTNGKNWFWRMYQMGVHDETGRYESFKFSTYANPDIDKKELDQIKLRTPKYLFDREYMAEFEDDGGSVFINISGCYRHKETPDLQIQKLEQLENTYVQDMLKKSEKGDLTIVFGVDFGQMDDYTVITVYEVYENSLIEYKRINKMVWEEILEVIKELDGKWQPAMILIESNNSRYQIERLQAEGLPVVGIRTTATTKPEFISNLALAIETKELSIPRDKELIKELSVYQKYSTPSGNIKYSAPKGFHDDIVMSLSLAFHASNSVVLPEELEIVSI